MRADLVGLARQVDRVGRRVRAGAGDDGGAVADGAEGDPDQLDALVVGERRRLAGRACDDDPVGAVIDQ